MSVGESECTRPEEDDNSAAATMDSDPTENALELRAEEPEVNPIDDIIDYLVHCARNAFPCARIGEIEPSIAHNTLIARNLFQKSVYSFLERFGKHLAFGHLEYFENSVPAAERENILRIIQHLKRYHSVEGKRKRIKNRRYRALQKLCKETDYFSDKEMMYRNPLLYEQLIGQFLTEKEIAERDGVDSDGLTFVNMILDTVDRNHMRQKKNEQELSEKMEISDISNSQSVTQDNKKSCEPTTLWGEFDQCSSSNNKSSARWGEFERPDTTPSFMPEVRKQSMISAPERELLRKEFVHEMFGDFLEGRDISFDYDSVDNNEQYDDLQMIDRDKEEEYFDSEPLENDNLEETMKLTHEYAHKTPLVEGEDELDVFMQHLNKRRDM